MATNTEPLIPMEDIYLGVNSLSKQLLGKEALKDDQIDWVDFGSSYEDLPSETKAIVTSGLVTLVTEQLNIHKDYRGNGVDIIRSRGNFSQADGIVQKNRIHLPDAVSDADTYNPAAGSSSNPFKANPITASTDYFGKKFQYRYEWTDPERWLTGAFLSEGAFNGFISGVSRQVDNAYKLGVEGLTMSTIRASMALNLNGGPGPRAYNLLEEYNDGPNSGNPPLLVAGALANPEFLRWALHRMFVVFDYMKAFSGIYNEKGFPQFTNVEDSHFILLSQFRRAVDQYLLSDAYHTEYLQLPLHDSVPTWKGFLSSGNTQPDFLSTSSIKDTFDPSWIDSEEEPLTIDQSGVIATIFNTERVGIHNLGVTATSQFDPVALRTNRWTHVAGQTIVDPYEVGVTFYIADDEDTD